MNIPFIPSPNHSGKQSKVNRIVIHCTVSPAEPGGARKVAGFFSDPKNIVSAHYVVDPGEIVQCVKEDVIAWHAPPNAGSIGIELCDRQEGPASRWEDKRHSAVLKLAGLIVEQVAGRWDIPLRRLSVADLKAGERGICGRADVSTAFNGSSHTDPGKGFPWARFMELIHAAR